MKLFYLAAALAGGLGIVPSLLGDPKVSFTNPVPPANNTRVFGAQCPGDLCIENCVFDLGKLATTIKMESSLFRDLTECTVHLLDSNGTTLASTNYSLSGTNMEVTPSWSGSKEVACGTTETLKVEVTVQEAEYFVTPLGTNVNYYYSSNSLNFALHCVNCAKATRTEGNGKTKIEQSTSDRIVKLGCMIMNMDTDPHLVDFIVSSESGWLVAFPPSPLLLDKGESREVFLDVTVPGSAPNGALERITVTSSFPDQPDSTSSTTMEIEIQTPLKLWVAEFAPNVQIVLRISGPWNTQILLERSENFTNWLPLSSIDAPPGTEFTDFSDVFDPALPADVSRFYRARIPAPADSSSAEKTP